MTQDHLRPTVCVYTVYLCLVVIEAAHKMRGAKMINSGNFEVIQFFNHLECRYLSACPWLDPTIMIYKEIP